MQINRGSHFVLSLMLCLLFTACTAYCSDYFVDPNGNDTTGNGTIGSPFKTITKGVSTAAAGDTIYVRGGTHVYTTTISISKSGTSGAKYYLFAYNGEKPILNFSGMADADGNRGIILSGSYWHFKGINIYGAGDNGMNMSGSNNIIELCTFYENRDSGLQLGGGAANNQIINCDSYYNRDSGDGNADGFSPKMDVGTGNYFYGCRSWNNSDDAYDGYLRGADDVTTTYENCWAMRAGYLKSGAVGTGNGNGFKMGGSDDKLLRHNVILKNCLSFQNKAKGFDQNSDKGDMTLYNCTAFNNGLVSGANFAIATSPLATGKTATVTNCTYNTGSNDLGSFVVQTTNDWTTTSADFVSIDPSAAYGPRKADGSLPDITFMHLATGSHLIDAGTNVGLPYNGSAPDIGCFETGGSSLPGAASSPVPSTGATNVSRTQDLSWTAGAGATSHDVYFGTVNPPPSIGNQAGTTYDTGTMAASTTYYWRVDEKNTYGTTTGTVWSFTTVPPPPGAASSPTPTNGAANVSRTQDLSWSAGSGVATRDVYFGTVNPPVTKVISDGTALTYDTGTMAYSTVYYWRVDEKNAGGTTTGTVWSFTTVAPPLPGAATNPAPTNGATSIGITTDLSWTAGSDAASHDVYFGTVNPPPSIGNQAGTTYDTGTMAYSTTYYWRIDEKNVSGTTTGTVWSFSTVPPSPPGTASNPTPANAATNISLTQDLSWTAGAGAASHDVYFGTVNPPPSIGNQAGTTYDTGTMAYSTTYYWRIDEKNIGGTTTGTLWNFTTVADTTPPAAPTGLEAIADDNAVVLDWSNNSEGDLAGYNVYRSTTSGSGYSKLNSTLVSDSNYIDYTAANGTTYYYVVTAVDTTSNESGYSGQVSATPRMYGDFIINGSVDMNDLSYFCDLWLVDDCNATADVDLDDNCMVNFYEFSAFAENWRKISFEPPDTIPPSEPTGLTATAGNATVGLDWNDNSESDLAGYNVYRSTTSGSGYTKLNGSLLTSSNYTDNSVTNGTTYYYVVTATDTNSNESDYSGEASAVPADTIAPAAPTGLTAAAGNAKVLLNWNDNSESDLAGYNIYRSTTSGSGYAKINTSLRTSSDYNDTGVTNGTTYYYVVTAADTASNESGYSSQASATPAGTSTITIQESTTGFCSVDPTGTIDNNNDGYTGTGFVNTQNATGEGINWSINILTAGTYTFTWRYSCTSVRPGDLLINGSTVLSGINFPATSSFTTWTTVTTSGVALTTGVKTIRLQATTSGGLANIDYIEITGPNLTTAACQ